MVVVVVVVVSTQEGHVNGSRWWRRDGGQWSGWPHRRATVTMMLTIVIITILRALPGQWWWMHRRATVMMKLTIVIVVKYCIILAGLVVIFFIDSSSNYLY